MKKDHHDHEAYQLLASRYIEIYGEKLAQENKELPGGALDTSGLDKKVFNRLDKKKKARRYIAPLTAAAACIVILFLYGPLADRTPENQQPEFPPAAQYEVIPLSFTMPEGYAVESYKQDYGETVYYIRHEQGDPVILSIAEGEQIFASPDMKEFIMDGELLYGVSRPEYQYITFAREGYVYQLSCQYDIKTLLNLCEAVL